MTDTTEQVVDQPAPDAIAPELETPVEGQAESSPAVTDADESSKPKGVQKRIDELTRLRYDAERDRDYWRQLAVQQQTPAKQEPAVAEKPKPAPKLEDFNYDEAAYQAALFQHVKDEASRAAREELQQERTREREQAKKQTFKQRETDFAKANPDYFTITRDPSLPFTRELVELAAESEMGPDVLHYLAKNREIADRIAELSPVAAAREIGRIEAKLEKPPAPVPKAPPVSKAPPPPPKIEATDSTPRVSTTSPDSDKLSDDEWVKAEQARLSRKVKRNV